MSAEARGRARKSGSDRMDGAHRPLSHATDERPLSRLLIGLCGSAVLHGLLVALLVTGILDSPTTDLGSPRERTVSFDIVQADPEPEPIPEPDPEPEPSQERRPPPPQPPPTPPEEVPEPVPAVEPRPIPVEPPPTPPPETPPPPSNDPDAEPAEAEDEPTPLNVGISMRSTVGEGESGAMRVGVGNTLYGRPDDVAGDPTEARPYSGGAVPEGDRVEPPAPEPTYVPPHQVSTLPRVQREVQAPYPEEARREGIGGRVVLRLRIDEAGRVSEAEVIEGPGFGLEEAAKEALMGFRFRPATLNGDAVSTDLRYVYTFLLD